MKKYLLILSFFTCTYLSKGYGCLSNPISSNCVEMCENEENFQANRGIYASLWGAANWFYLHEKAHGQSKFKTGYATALAVGYQFNSSCRAEAEISYRRNKLASIKIYQYKVPGRDHQVSAVSCMANAYYDYNLKNRWTPYVGAGIGYAQLKSHGHANVLGTHFKDDTWRDSFAYQVILGVNYEIAFKTSLGLDYRYFHAEQHIKNHSVGLSLKRLF
jgi:opacity protein-like surface antigen